MPQDFHRRGKIHASQIESAGKSITGPKDNRLKRARLTVRIWQGPHYGKIGIYQGPENKLHITHESRGQRGDDYFHPLDSTHVISDAKNSPEMDHARVIRIGDPPKNVPPPAVYALLEHELGAANALRKRGRIHPNQLLLDPIPLNGMFDGRMKEHHVTVLLTEGKYAGYIGVLRPSSGNPQLDITHTPVKTGFHEISKGGPDGKGLGPVIGGEDFVLPLIKNALVVKGIRASSRD
jgi:hypothetical protein